jgi:hypothetical protein
VIIIKVKFIGSTKKVKETKRRATTTTESSVFDNSCSYSSFEVCLTKIQEVTQNSSLAFASNKKDLKEACRYAGITTTQ